MGESQRLRRRGQAPRRFVPRQLQELRERRQRRDQSRRSGSGLINASHVKATEVQMILAAIPFTPPQSIAHALLVMAIVPAVGLALGAMRYRGIALGPAAVVFAGIVFGYFGQRIDPAILGFARDFGLIMFIFSLGLQLGPGFPSVMREQGLRLNGLAMATVCIGVLLAIILTKILRIDPAATLGLLAGATTNTPS